MHLKLLRLNKPIPATMGATLIPHISKIIIIAITIIMYLREFDIQLSKDNGAIFLLLIKEFISGFNKIKKIKNNYYK